MGNPIYYLAHDPVSNTEAVLNEYAPELIASAASAGIVFVAVDSDGNRSIASPDEVSEPQVAGGDFVIVQPVYVDDRIKAVVHVFDALASGMTAPTSTLSMLDEEPSSSEQALFMQALEALRALAYGIDDGGDER